MAHEPRGAKLLLLKHHLFVIVTIPFAVVTTGVPEISALSPRMVDALTFQGIEAKGETVVINPEVESTHTVNEVSIEETQRRDEDVSAETDEKLSERENISKEKRLFFIVKGIMKGQYEVTFRSSIDIPFSSL
jgi:hypothetical protein